MDDVATFGPVFHRLGFTDAISRGLLTDYRVLVVGVDDAMCRKWVDAGALASIDGKTATDARTLAADGERR
jgi:predicted helicase